MATDLASLGLLWRFVNRQCSRYTTHNGRQNKEDIYYRIHLMKFLAHI